MNQEDLLNAIGTVDEEVLEKTEKKPKRNKLWIIGVVAAACVLMMLILPFLSPRYHVVSEEALHWKPEPQKEGNTSGSWTFNYVLAFKSNFSIEARILRLFPDTYYNLHTKRRCRIAEILVVDVIVGKNLPKVIYCALPDLEYDHIGEVDSLVLTIGQLGMEGCYPLLNEQTNRIERFGLLFGNAFCGLAMFSNGKLEESVEDLKGWNRLTHFCDGKEWCMTDHPNYPYQRGCSLAEAKSALKELANTHPEAITTGVQTSAIVRKALEYVSKTENGSYFVCITIGHGEYTFKRYIDGYVTNEEVKIHVEKGTVEYSGEKITKEDLKTAPSVEKAISIIKPEELELPNEPPLEEGDKREFMHWRATYTKHKGKLYCNIMVTWVDKIYSEDKNEIRAYIKIVTPDGMILDYDHEKYGNVTDFLDSL